MVAITSFQTPADLSSLNQYLQSRSFIKGFAPSQADTCVFEAISSCPLDFSGYDHIRRWASHISSFEDKKNSFAGAKETLAQLNISLIDVEPTVTEKADDDDIDLFGSDEEDDAEAEALKTQRLAEYHAKKASKPKVIAKSSVIFDVKPWDDTTDMKAMEEAVRGIIMDGLIWGTVKLIPVGYGIKKLQISCAVEDDKVSVDSIEEAITSNEELVQSVDIVAFNKI